MYYHRSQPLVYVINSWDNYQWKAFSQGSPKTREIVKEGEEKITEFGSFSKEVFHRLHNQSPLKVQKVRTEALWALKCHDQLSNLPEWQSLEGKCCGDRFLSGVAATSFLIQLVPNLPTPPEQLANVQQMRQEVAGLREMKQYMLDTGDEEAAEKAQQMIDEAVELGKEAVAQAVDYAESIEDYSHEFRNACQAALDEVEKMNDALGAFGFGQGEERDGASLQDKMALGKKISKSEKLKQIAIQAGRLKRLREGAGSKRQSESLEQRNYLTSVEVGNDLNRTLSSEFIFLLEDESFSIFAQKYIESQLFQYKLEGREQMGSGPVIILIDSSGSMRGEREIWAKAVCLNLVMVAQSNGRDFAIIHFDHGTRRTDYFSANEFGQAARDKLIASMMAFFDGGTDFQEPLENAMDLIRGAKNELGTDWKKADIVLLTDGHAPVFDSWLIPFNQAKQLLKCTVYGVLIETSETDAVRSVCDNIVSVSELAKDVQIAEVLTSV
jgi:uncharacterized protein with von Willebrand factor type A (vWA) domain